MTSFDLSVTNRRFTSFVNKAFVLLVLWVVVVIAGLQYYIFDLDGKHDRIKQEIHQAELSLNKLNSALLHDDSNRNAVLSEEIKNLHIHFEILGQYGAINVANMDAALQALKSEKTVEHKDTSETFQQLLSEVKTFYALKDSVDLEQLKRLLIGFGVFSSVFILLLMSSIRTRIRKYTDNGSVDSLDNTQGYLAFEKEWNLNEEFYNKVFLYSCFQRMQEPCFVLNEKREVRYANQAFSAIWSESKEGLVELLCLDRGTYDELKKLVVPQGSDDSSVRKIHLNGVSYSYTEAAIWDGSSIIGYECKLLLESGKLEYDALSKSIALMEQDVWDAPIRVLRKGSPIVALANQLEAVRLRVLRFFDEINTLSEASSLVQTKKLTHILTLFQDIKKGEFDFDFNPHDVLRLSENLSLALEKSSEESVSEISAFVEDLHAHCERIINADEGDTIQKEEIERFLLSIESGLSELVKASQQSSVAILKKSESRVLTLEEALQRLHDAKEVTLNAMNEGSYEEDEVDFKQFFIDDVESQMTAAINMVDKAFTSEKAAFDSSDPELQMTEEKLKEVHALCVTFVSKKTDADDLVDQVRFLTEGLSAFDAKIQQILKGNQQKNNVDSTVEAEENGDW